MSFLIHHISRTAGGGIERTESIVDGDSVTIGRATDQNLHIPDRTLPLQHSVIRDQGSDLQIRATAGAFLFVNEERTTSSRLRAGDLVEISSYRILVSEPPEGSPHKYYLRVEAGEIAAQEIDLGAQFKTSLDQSGLGKRWVSWTLALLILASGLAIPAVGLISSDIAKTLRSIPLVPDDTQWSSGPLHPSHKFIYGEGQDSCGACHLKAFEHAPDEACIACHRFVEHHVDITAHGVPQLDNERCASCHEEHHEPAALTRRDQEHCSVCHADLAATTTGETDLRNVTDFYNDHPEFKVTMLMPEGRGQDTKWHVERVSLADPDLEEQSNLKFPHDIHLNPNGIDSQVRGRIVMECRDCHRLESGGQYIEPVSMEQHCAECHELNFDAQDPTRQVPHGDTEAVMQMLREFYARRFLETGGVAAPAASSDRPGRGRRRSEPEPAPSAPSKPVSRSVNTLQALASADEQAQEAASSIFEERTCTICHTISDADDPNATVAWQVNPVRLTRIWMPKSWFDHEAHATYECTFCHLTVRNSTESVEVNMPGIGICRDCHGGEDTPGLLGSTCIDCHRFHIPGLEVMKPDVEGAMRREDASRMMPIREVRTGLVE